MNIEKFIKALSPEEYSQLMVYFSKKPRIIFLSDILKSNHFQEKRLRKGLMEMFEYKGDLPYWQVEQELIKYRNIGKGTVTLFEKELYKFLDIE